MWKSQYLMLNRIPWDYNFKFQHMTFSKQYDLILIILRLSGSKLWHFILKNVIFLGGGGIVLHRSSDMTLLIYQ